MSAPGEGREVVLERAVQVPLVAAAGDEIGLGEPGEGVGDRRPLRPDELPEQPVGERERQADAAQLHLAPAPGEVP